jgi:hypothetical protein
MEFGKDLLPKDYREVGLQAEFHPDGRLARLGKFVDGRPDGWVLTLDPHRHRARVERLEADNYPDSDRRPGESEIGEDNFLDWVVSWIGEIYLSARSHMRCSFCGKFETEVARLIAGPTSYICDECVGLCVKVLEDNPIEEDMDDG